MKPWKGELENEVSSCLIWKSSSHMFVTIGFTQKEGKELVGY